MEYIETVSEMRKLHTYSEMQFLSFNKIVPYNHNPTEVYSPRLYSILQDSCAQVISILDLVTKRLNLSRNRNSKGINQEKFGEFFRLLNEKQMLSIQNVAPIEKTDMTISPFKFRKQNVPKWWQDYNDTKHDLPKGAYVGTIRNVMNALAAVTILHYIAERLVNLHDRSSIMTGNNWRDNSDEVREDIRRLRHTTAISGAMHLALGGFLTHKSRVFLYLTEFHSL